MDLFIIAMSRYNRQKYDQTIDLCNQMLALNPDDQVNIFFIIFRPTSKKAAWLLKCNSLIRKQYIDDLEIDEEGVGDLLLDENSAATVARPGTSFQRPLSSKADGNTNPVILLFFQKKT